MKCAILPILLGAALATFAADRLVSNFTYAVAPGSVPGELRVVARGDAQSGVSVLGLGLADGNLQVLSVQTTLLDRQYALVPDFIFSGLTGERRRVAVATTAAGELWIPYYVSGDGSLIEPEGLVSFSGGAFQAEHLSNDTLVLADSLPADRAVGGMFADHDTLWMAQGSAGLVKWVPSTTVGERWLFDSTATQLVNAATVDSVAAPFAPIYGLASHFDDRAMWLATVKGLWMRQADGTLNASAPAELTKSRVTGVWSGGDPWQIVAETAVREGSLTRSALWRSLDSGKTFQNIMPAYDSLDVVTTAVAFVGDRAWLAIQSSEGSRAGLVRIDTSGPVAWTDSLPAGALSTASRWIWGLDAGVLDRDVHVTGICSFPLSDGRLGLALSSFGGGLSLSADSGKTWRPFLNQTEVKSNLSEIRLVPSVLRYQGATALVAYRLTQDSRIDIEIFSYDMKRVRKLVAGAARSADPVRSSDPRVDVWDGRDDAGREVAMGIYYVKVTDNHGHTGWGKVMTLGGRP